jgi:putative endonuclease
MGQRRAGAVPAVPAASSDRRARIGRQGEQVVADWYEARGFTVLDRNWRCSLGELDLVLADEGGRQLVFCEVKTRTSSAFGSPFEAVTAQKVRRLRRLAGRWMAQAKPRGLSPAQVRLDVAAVRAGPGATASVEVVEGAF